MYELPKEEVDRLKFVSKCLLYLYITKWFNRIRNKRKFEEILYQYLQNVVFNGEKKFGKLLLNCTEISISKTKEKSRLKGRCQIWFIRMIDKTAEPVAVKAWRTRGQVLFNFFGCFWRYFKLLGFLVGFTKYLEARSSTLSINDCEFLFLNMSKGAEAWSGRLAEAVVRMCCVERVFLEFCRIPRKRSVPESLF